ncbi:MAG: transposase [Deltaproteobacteria bacterium]|nr:transposase [Deltaproteobacteria bacterium]
MDRVKIIPLGFLPQRAFQAIRDGSLEGGRIWNQCRDLHLEARRKYTKWPTKSDLQRATKGRYALHSQTIQMICHSFLANVEATRDLRRRHPEMKMKYPWRDKTFRPLAWPAQAVRYEVGKVILPMGRGRPSLVLRAKLPSTFGSVKLVWNCGYELHVCYGCESNKPQTKADALATVDLGEIHQATVTTDTGKSCIVSGRGIRSLKQGRHKAHGRFQKLLSRCKPGSRRHKKLSHCKAKLRVRTERRIRDVRHKGTRKVIAFCQQAGVKRLFVGNPDGVRRNRCGRKHNQRMSGWEYGKDIQYLKEKSSPLHIECFTGGERGTSSRCPECDHRQKVRGREWRCRACNFCGHRDVVGSVNMFPLAYGKKVAFPALVTYLRAGSVRKQRGANNLVVAQAQARSSRAVSPLGSSEPCRLALVASQAASSDVFLSGNRPQHSPRLEAHPL